MQDLLEALLPIARQAGEAIMAVHRKGAKADHKSDGSPVTQADRAAEAIILEGLSHCAPGIAIISEENAQSHSIAPPDRFFLVDPLDGTKEFLKNDGKGAFTVNIALIEEGEPVLGVVLAPALDRLFFGAVGGGAFEEHGNKRHDLYVRQLSSSGPVAVASASHRDGQTDAWLTANGIRQTTAIGSSLKFCLVACGEADVYPRFGPTMEWDTAAGDGILRAAGGSVTHVDGTPYTYGKPGYRSTAFIAWGDKGS